MKAYFLALLLAGLSGPVGLARRGARLSAALLAAAAISGIIASAQVLYGGQVWSLDLPLGLFQSSPALRFDAIAAFFLVPTLLLPALAARFGLAYWDDHQESARSVRCFLGLLTVSLALLVAAAHAFVFLLAWETMAIAAFLLVLSSDREPEARRAGWLYLVSTHAGTLCLFGAFALLPGFSLTALPAGFAASARGTQAFVLFLLGFGLKAGVFPLHFWLPGAHAAAPSHVSAVMSGVMIKMGILGLARVFAWVPDPPLWWGGLLVALGAASGILGVVFALGQHDLKRLLAYHSIENIGIILMGLGLGAVGKATGNASLQLLGFGGAALHVLNHGLFKGLLFLSAGSAIHATGTRELDRMGGLAQAMPWTSGAFLAGAWAICGLPPFNGFVSEWLIYLGAFHGLGDARWPWAGGIVLALALIGALALACFAKAFGTVFLGQARHGEPPAHESPAPMVGPMVLLALACLLVGTLPLLLAPALERVAGELGSGALPPLRSLAFLPVLTGAGLALLLAGALLWLGVRSRGARRTPTWDCGYASPTPRMQYTASSFAASLVKALAWVLRPEARGAPVRGAFPAPAGFRTHVPDPVLDSLATPAATGTVWVLARLRFLQSGYLPVYLLYVLLTLLALFIWKVA
ncbi:MAG TPA: proton-conducting transporter membrane subunit [Holophagaceae bacterium]|nr:proton-conducting transporter membrane subunit [Holophagaceae bacterium]